jgi:hypothetical protein
LAEITAGKLFMTKSNAMREGYDFLFIDTPAAPEADVAQAVNIADFCLVAGRPSFLDLAPIVRSAEAVRRLGKGGLVVLNQAHTNKPEVAPVAFPEIMEALRFCGLPLAPTACARARPSRRPWRKAAACPNTNRAAPPPATWNASGPMSRRKWAPWAETMRAVKRDPPSPRLTGFPTSVAGAETASIF